MSKRKVTKRKGNKPPLDSRVEQVHAGSIDSLDRNVLEYVDQFFHSFSSMAPLPRTNLLTPEGARQALEVLDKKQAEIHAHMRTAKALRKMLESQQQQEDGSAGEQ